MEKRIPSVGESIIWHDSRGKAHNALVTSVHGENCVNLVYVSDNEREHDQYGRQTKRDCSVVHKSITEAHGNYWRYANEEPRPVLPPLET